ncbi:MAG: hypothetical protein ACLQOZ_13820 [Acidimicrobiales bacterium]|jgi:hypothetical protein
MPKSEKFETEVVTHVWKYKSPDDLDKLIHRRRLDGWLVHKTETDAGKKIKITFRRKK